MVDSCLGCCRGMWWTVVWDVVDSCLGCCRGMWWTVVWGVVGYVVDSCLGCCRVCGGQLSGVL